MQEIYESNKAAFKQLAFMKTISSTTINVNRVHAKPPSNNNRTKNTPIIIKSSWSVLMPDKTQRNGIVVMPYMYICQPCTLHINSHGWCTSSVMLNGTIQWSDETGRDWWLHGEIHSFRNDQLLWNSTATSRAKLTETWHIGLLQPLQGDFRSNNVTSGSLSVTWRHVRSFPVT